MFGLGRRKDAQAVEAMREQLAAADMHARSVLAAVAQTDSRWSKDREDRSRVQQSTETALDAVRSSAAENAADITRALYQVAEMCALVVERLEADRLERRALTDAINLLARQQASPLETPSQVLGGMVLAAPEPERFVEIPRNGDASRNGEISLNGDTPHVEEISLADYETEPASAVEPVGTVEAFGTVEPFGRVEPARPVEPFKAVDVVEPITATEPASSVGARGTWETVPQPRPVQPVAVVVPVEAPAPVAPEKIADPVAEVEPPRTYDAFAGLPLLSPVEPAKVFESVATPPAVEEPAADAPVDGEADGLDRQWSDSYRLTENNSFRPHGGTRLTPRRSTTRASTR